MISITGFLMIVFWGLVGGCVYLVYRPSGGLHLHEVQEQVHAVEESIEEQGVSRRAERPRVIANFALTADGKVSTRNFTPTRFTSRADKRRLQEIRCLGDALARRRTHDLDRSNEHGNLGERPARTAQGNSACRAEPLRVIVSNRGEIDPRLEGVSNGWLSSDRFFHAKNASEFARVDRATRRSLDFQFSESRSRSNAPHPPEPLPGADGRLRRRPKAVSSAPGDRGRRRTPPYVDAADIRRSRGAHAHRDSRWIPAENHPLPAERIWRPRAASAF